MLEQELLKVYKLMTLAEKNMNKMYNGMKIFGKKYYNSKILKDLKISI